GSLRSSSQISPQEFLIELKGGATDERLFACLDSLRVSLTSNPVSTLNVVLAHAAVCYGRERRWWNDPQSESNVRPCVRSIARTLLTPGTFSFVPPQVSTLDRCALVPTCVGRWNIKHVISLGSNKMGCQFSPGTRMKKKFLHKLFQRELPSFIFVPVPLLPACVQRVHSGCRMYWSEHLLETFLLSPVSMFSCAVVVEGGELAQLSVVSFHSLHCLAPCNPFLLVNADPTPPPLRVFFASIIKFFLFSLGLTLTLCLVARVAQSNSHFSRMRTRTLNPHLPPQDTEPVHTRTHPCPLTFSC
ncbi:hypothetical protein PO909_020320, partial [Leuciscus waleckii]